MYRSFCVLLSTGNGGISMTCEDVKKNISYQYLKMELHRIANHFGLTEEQVKQAEEIFKNKLELTTEFCWI